ncbi:MAG: CdaR family protein [Balneolaceae bacterium]
MAEISDNKYIKGIKNFFKPGTKPGADETQKTFARRENLVVFIASFILAISLWLIVNLNGSFSIDMNIPVEPTNIPENMSLTESFPEFVQVGISGDGWQLFSLYNDPPSITISVDEGDINLFEQVRQRLSYLQGIDISKVQPLLLSVDLEPKISKKVPVKINTDFSFQNRHGLIGKPNVIPDSITVTGAESLVEDVNVWEIEDTLRLSGIRDNITETIPLQKDRPLVELSMEEVIFTAEVSEFTEGETTVYIRTRDLPRGQNINYNPSAVTIKYDVPLKQYSEVNNMQPFEVYVPYSKIIEDSTGFVTPDIEQTAEEYELRLRSFRPKVVAYFSVLEQ